MSRTLAVSPNMSKSEVMALLGAPILSDFSEGVEEWYYCSTGMGGDEFVAFWFHDDKLVQKTSYTVSLEDAGGTGDCKLFAKRGTYVTPDVVIALRMGY